MRVYSRSSPARFAARVLSLLLLALLAGCATAPPTGDATGATPPGCLQLFVDNDRLIDRAERRDQGVSRVAGFPYLRSDRFLASFRNEVTGSDQLERWTYHLAALDGVARRLEINNLPDPALRRQAQAQLPRLDRCREQLRQALLTDPESLRRLRTASAVADDYVMSWRVFGLYPVTAPFVSLRIANWHDDTAARFTLPLDRLAVTGKLTRWSTRRPESVTGATPEWDHDALGIPQLSEATARRLFARHAPVWEVDVASNADHIGTLEWADGATVDTRRASEYRLISYTRFQGRILPQLNYLVWFPSRPSRDIYGGRFDGLHWRVTLGPDGTPLLYDSIHHCGCYYMAFPTAQLRPRPDHQPFTEPALMPQPAPPGPLVLRIAPVTHYIERLYPLEGGPNATGMAQQPYDRLRSLPAESGHRSLFADHGLVADSQRPERFILWPMGIRSPGAMRQVGRHAIAFVGRRHFDDPFLIPALFEAVAP
jgi:hypothetical protein